MANYKQMRNISKFGNKTRRHGKTNRQFEKYKLDINQRPSKFETLGKRYFSIGRVDQFDIKICSHSSERVVNRKISALTLLKTCAKYKNEIVKANVKKGEYIGISLSMEEVNAIIPEFKKSEIANKVKIKSFKLGKRLIKEVESLHKNSLTSISLKSLYHHTNFENLYMVLDKISEDELVVVTAIIKREKPIVLDGTYLIEGKEAC